MEKKNKIFDFTMLITSLICVLPIIVGVFLWDKLPDTMIRHVDFSMNPNGWASKSTVVFVFPLILLGVNLFVNIFLNLSFRNSDSEPGKFIKVIKYMEPIIGDLVFVILFLMNLGKDLITGEQSFTLTSIGCAVVFLIIGNYIPKAKDLRGINLPVIKEILSKDENLWFRVKRMWSRIIIISSILLIATSFLPFTLSFIFFFVWVCFIAFSPYVLVKIYRK